MKSPSFGRKERPAISLRISAIAVLVILAIGGYILVTDLASGGKSNSSITGSQTTTQSTSAVGTISTVTGQEGTIALKSYDWTSFNNLTMVVSDNSNTVPFVINAITVGGTSPRSVNVTAGQGGCSPSGSSQPYKLPATCNPGEAITIFVTPPDSISPCSGPGVNLIVTIVQTQRFVNLNASVGASSANPNGTQPQNCTSEPEVGYFSGPLGQNAKTYVNLAPLQGHKYIEINFTFSWTAEVYMYLRNSSSTVYTTALPVHPGAYSYCVPASGSYELELYNYASSTALTVHVYEITNGSCTPGG